jgi:hypothetical protein
MTNVDAITEGVKLIEQGMRRLSGGPLDYYLKQLVKARELLLTRFAPFKVGDRIILWHTPIIEPESGWYCSRHFLVAGSLGTVKESDCDGEGRLRFYVEFDNETWIDYDGKEQPVISKHRFCFFEQQLILEQPR